MSETAVRGFGHSRSLQCGQAVSERKIDVFVQAAGRAGPQQKKDIGTALQDQLGLGLQGLVAAVGEVRCRDQ